MPAIDRADAPFSLLPGGRLLRHTPAAASNATTLERVRDLGFHELTKLNKKDPILLGAFQFSLLAGMGWSQGAATVAEFGRVDSRCLAVGALEGGPAVTALEELNRTGQQKPSLTTNRPGNPIDFLFKLATREAYWLQISGAIHPDFKHVLVGLYSRGRRPFLRT